MLFSKFFCPILKNKPRESSIVSHSLMLQAGLIRQSSPGIYVWLPLGLKVLDKISNIVKNEMNKTEALNILMPTIQSAEIWKKSGRYEGYGLEMLRINDRHNKEMLYGPTNEEQITQIFSDNIKSYKSLPLNLYQIQWKFRDEIRPRFGVMRGREFLMKDAYSFDLTQADAEISYKKMFACYLKIFQTLGLKAIPMQADTGPIGGDLSHEFMILADTGESEVHCDKNILNLSLPKSEISYANDIEKIYTTYTQMYAATDEKHDITNNNYISNKNNIVTKRGIEVGHIFYFGTKYSEKFQAEVLTPQGENTTVYMGSYGIGISRLLGALIEANHDDKGIIWHKNVAPFDIIINALTKTDDITKSCYKIYQNLLDKNIAVLYNDSNENAGDKLATADLLGIPYQINIGTRSIKNQSMEFKNRATGNIIEILLQDIPKILAIIKD